MDLKKVDSPYKTKDILKTLIEMSQCCELCCTFQKVDSPYKTNDMLVKIHTQLIKTTLKKVDSPRKRWKSV